jgi:hypothetical protein
MIGPGASAGPAPIVAAVVSSDPVWARLLALNLSARGIAARDHSGADLQSALGELPKGGWLIFDTDGLHNDDVVTWQSVAADMGDVDVSAALVVDYGLRRLAPSETWPDVVIERSPDMRVMVRKLMSAFTATPLERTLASLQAEW